MLHFYPHLHSNNGLHLNGLLSLSRVRALKSDMVGTRRLKIELQQGKGGMVQVPYPTSHPLFRVRNNNCVSHGEPLDHEDFHLR